MKTLILSGMLSVIALAGCSSTSSNASSSTEQASNNIGWAADTGASDLGPRGLDAAFARVESRIHAFGGFILLGRRGTFGSRDIWPQ